MLSSEHPSRFPPPGARLTEPRCPSLRRARRFQTGMASPGLRDFALSAAPPLPALSPASRPLPFLAPAPPQSTASRPAGAAAGASAAVRCAPRHRLPLLLAFLLLPSFPAAGRPEAGGAREQRPDVQPAGSRRGPSPVRADVRKLSGRLRREPGAEAAGRLHPLQVRGSAAGFRELRRLCSPWGVPGRSSRCALGGGKGEGAPVERCPRLQTSSASGTEAGRGAPGRCEELGGPGRAGPGARAVAELTSGSGSGRDRRADLPALSTLLQLPRSAAGCAAFSFNFKAVRSLQST